MDNPCKNVKELTLNNKKERVLNGNEINALKLELAKSKNKFLPYIVQHRSPPVAGGEKPSMPKSSTLTWEEETGWFHYLKQVKPAVFP